MAEILVTSLVSHRDHSPRIDITLNGNRVQLSAMEARALVRNISEAIVAAESDAFIYAFITSELKQPLDVGAHTMILFRDFRDKLETQWRNNDER
jgi:hypothetical protein